MYERLMSILGEPVTYPTEEVFVVFSQAIPSQSLGFVDARASTIEITVAGRDLTIYQSPGLLTSDRKEGTTGAVVWKVSPLFAEWIATPTNFLFQGRYLSSDTIALELGAGVSGIVALTLGHRIKKYIATDQDYVTRLLNQNISENSTTIPTNKPSKKPTSRKKRVLLSNKQPAADIQTLVLDWELDSVTALPLLLDQGHIDSDTNTKGVDLVIACDCIYNDSLIEPLNNTCAQICQLRSSSENPTICLIAQQLRSPEIFEAWLASFHRLFHVFRVPDGLLTEPLRKDTGFIVHVGIVR
ncbi:hypothetical protein CC78DRAFT_536238 [Lojkania enalia]|uniref:Diaminohydroxyphosphoribosylamino-pyrimidine deaminase n=1 Tax=Lojkania enalia TaxID=147567 RepID=A0A9P4N0R1_9PLEO|nr:hypothetical protein CC78DRAFT_536238 [Didymosphaeria enalia]